MTVSCQTAAPADPDTRVGSMVEVYAPVATDRIGDMFVQEDGFWAFRTTDATRIKSYRRGALVAFGDLNQRDRHLYAVISQHQWGVRLQRLDTNPVSSRSSGALIPLSQVDRQTGARWSFCAGSGPPQEDPCLTESPVGTRYRLYPRSDVRLKLADERSAATFPVVLSGIATNGAFGVDVVSIDPPTEWFAIAETGLHPRPTRPRIAVDPACDAIGSAHRDSLDAQWIRTPVTAPENALQTMSEAVRLGADALVWCDKRGAHVGVPTLMRPGIVVPGGDIAVPPMLGARTQTFGAQSTGVDFVARAGAAFATGDFATGDYVIEAAVRAGHAGKRMEAVLVDAMGGVSAGGRPEAAARYGGFATRKQWNPKNSAPWQLGMAHVEMGLGDRQGAITRAGELADVFERAGDERLFKWFQWFVIADKLRAGASPREVLGALDSTPALKLAAEADRLHTRGDPLTDLQARFAEQNAMDAYSAFAGELQPLSCDGSRCAADVYGRLWSGGNVDPVALTRVRPAFLAPGYDAQFAVSDDIQTVIRIAAVHPLLPLQVSESSAEIAADTAVRWAAGGCSKAASNGPEFDTLRKLGTDIMLRVPDPQVADQMMAWVAAEGVPSICLQTEGLVDRAKAVAESIGPSEVPAKLLAFHVERATNKDALAVTEAAAHYAVEWERAELCAHWVVAIAAAYADAQDYDRGRQWIQQASRCDVADRSTIDLVAAFLAFQRTARASPDWSEQTVEVLKRITHSAVPGDVCAGAEPLEYRITPSLPAEVRQLVERFEPGSRPTQAELSLVTAADRVASAAGHLARINDQLEARDFSGAAKSLEYARKGFLSVSHEVGLARVRWLESTVFGGKSTEIVADPALFAKHGLPMLRKPKTTLSGAASSGDPDASLARAISTDGVGDLQAQVTNRKALCEVEVTPEGTVKLERVDGVLQSTEPDDGGPEIELIERH